MPSISHDSIFDVVLALSCGIAILGATGVGASPRASDARVDTANLERLRPDASPQRTSPDDTVAATEVDESRGDQLIELAVLILIFGPILALCLAFLFSIPSTILGVSLVMDGGCLRYLLFLLGWLFAAFYGLLFGAVVADLVLGVNALVEPLAHVFIWGYPVAAWWVHRRFQSMPREQYRAWEQSLTGGALVGFGAGSVASMLRSVAALKGGGFGGFGGGSFGGSGASGSWSGTAGTAAGTSSVAGATTGVAGTPATPEDPSTNPEAGVENTSRSARGREPVSGMRRLLLPVKRWAAKFEWYHGVVFALVTLVFVPFGLGTVRALQNTKVFAVAVASVVLYSVYRLVRRRTEARRSTGPSAGPGGEASSVWS